MPIFSLQELDFASDPTVMLIKMRVMEKVSDFLGDLKNQIKKVLRENNYPLIEKHIFRQAKISKGENYKYLPYSILDYPADFSKNDVFAVRTMFYWGNFISTTFHLQGKFKEEYGEKIMCIFANDHDVYFCVNDTAWEYTYDPNNYLPLDKISLKQKMEFFQKSEFIKISMKFEIAAIEKIDHQIISFIQKGLKSL